MALPVTISGTDMLAANSYHGPFLSSGGNYYAIVLDSTNAYEIEAWKATDPTSSFTEQDSAGKPTGGASDDNVLSLWTFQVSDNLHIATQDADNNVLYHIFNMATDNWDTVEESVQAITDSDSQQACSIMVRSDGDVIVMYQTEEETLHGSARARTAYARKEGTWTTDVALDTAGLVDWVGCVIVPGSSDRSHFFFKNLNADDGYQRTLTSGNSLETFPSASDTTTGFTNPGFGHGVSYDDGGTQKIRCPYVDANNQISYAEFDSADTPGTWTINADVSDNDVSGAIMCLSAEGTNEHLLYSNADDTQDLYHDENDGTDTQILDAVTVNAVSCNVYTRSGATVLAYVYDDAGTVKYNEVELIAAGGTAVQDPIMRGVVPFSR